MRTIWYDSPNQLWVPTSTGTPTTSLDPGNPTATAWIYATQKVTDIILYWHPGDRDGANDPFPGMPKPNSAPTVSYINILNRFLLAIGYPPIRVYVQLPEELLRLATETDPGTGHPTAKAKEAANRVRTFVREVLAMVADQSWIAGWYLFDEPNLRTTEPAAHSWMTANLAGVICGQLDTLEGEVPTPRKERCIAFGASWDAQDAATVAWRKTWTERSPTDLALPIDLWLFDLYPVERYHEQFSNGEFSSDISWVYSVYERFVQAVKHDDSSRQYAYIAQAFGYDPEHDALIGSNPADATQLQFYNRFTHPTLLEARGMVATSPMLGRRVASLWAHYKNSTTRLATNFGPVTQELAASLTPVAGYMPDDVDAWFIARTDPVATPPSITYWYVDVLRADGVTWQQIWTSPIGPGPAPLGVTVPLTFQQTVSPGHIPLAPNDGVFLSQLVSGVGVINPATGFLPGDLKLRIRVSKTATFVGVAARFQFGAGPGLYKVDVVQRYDESDPEVPGFVASWDGVTREQYVYFDLTQLRSGSTASPVVGPLGVPTALTLFSNCSPFFKMRTSTSDPLYPTSDRWVALRANYPEIDANYGHNSGLYGRIFRNAAITGNPTAGPPAKATAYLLLYNASALVVTIPAITLFFDVPPPPPPVSPVLGFPSPPAPGPIPPIGVGLLQFGALTTPVPYSPSLIAPWTVTLTAPPPGVIHPYEVAYIGFKDDLNPPW